MRKPGKRVVRAFFSLFILSILVLGAAPLMAQDNPLWLRYPAISPDGQTILFCYKGDIYKVPAAGGQAVPADHQRSLTTSPRSGATTASPSPSPPTATATSTSSSCRPAAAKPGA